MNEFAMTTCVIPHGPKRIGERGGCSGAGIADGFRSGMFGWERQRTFRDHEYWCLSRFFYAQLGIMQRCSDDGQQTF